MATVNNKISQRKCKDGKLAIVIDSFDKQPTVSGWII
ncbi:hypothetical protein DERP_011464 [Dermatophagoides pteronyssinus]|uniref:Uncharacterized protein n=1 Tax=Dermatophagoides pteronyssinus TaxID=6956 RepID=A0ABQ8J5F8_DERPT|nr:hypothetical protein DERP_011464 [Dermatophagoides pteronyssinus]